VVGATGALYAARCSLLAPIPAETILDDVLLPLQVARQGARVIFDGRARAWDDPDLGAEREFRRKVRTLTGNYQLLQIAPWVLSGANPLRFRFVSHKLLRLVVPFALAVLLVTSAAIPAPLYRAAFALQLAFYALSLFALSQPCSVQPAARSAEASRQRGAGAHCLEYSGGGCLRQLCDGAERSVDPVRAAEQTIAPRAVEVAKARIPERSFLLAQRILRDLLRSARGLDPRPWIHPSGQNLRCVCAFGIAELLWAKRSAESGIFPGSRTICSG
jgi:hypothetical protein